MIRKLYRNRLALPGITVVPVDLPTVIGNVFTFFCETNRRAVSLADVSGNDLDSMVEFCLKRPREWRFSADPKAHENFFDVRKYMDNLPEPARGIAKALTYDAIPWRDFGRCVKGQVSSECDWVTTWVQATGLHTPVAHVSPPGVVTATIESCPDGFLPSPAGTASEAIARALTRIDRGRFSLTGLVPRIAQIGDFARQDFGLASLALQGDEIEYLTATFVLYRLQLPILVARCQKRWYEKRHELGIRYTRRGRSAAEAYMEDLEYVARKPLHPLLAYIASGFNTGSFNTLVGVRDAIWRIGASVSPGVPAASGIGLAPSDMPCDPTLIEGNLGSTYMYTAVKLKMKAADCGPMGWGRWERDATTTLHDPGGSAAVRELEPAFMEHMSIPALAEMMRQDPALEAMLDRQHQALAWGDGPTADLDQLDLAGPEFTLLDGVAYSAPPHKSLFGLSPAISAASAQLTPVSEMVIRNWNGVSNARLSSWVVTAPGHMDASVGAEAMARYYLPGSAILGEEVRVSHMSTVSDADPVGLELLRYYSMIGRRGALPEEGKDPTPLFLDLFRPLGYDDPRRLERGVVVNNWQTYVHAATQSDAARAWRSDLRQWLTPLEICDFWRATSDEGFHTRSPVLEAHRGYSLSYSELGDFLTRPDISRGLVIDSDPIEISHADSALGAVTEILPTGGSKAIPKVEEKKAVDIKPEDDKA